MPRFLFWILLPCYLAACASWQVQEVSPQQALGDRPADEARLTLIDGNRIVMEQPRVLGDSLTGIYADRQITISLNAVTEVELPAGWATRGPSQPLRPGRRVRITAEDSGVIGWTGTLRVLNSDSIVLEDGLDLPLASVTKLEVYRGKRTRTGEGAGKGFVIGAFTGVVLGIAACSSPGAYVSQGQCAVGGGLVFGAGGALLGGLIGALAGADRWEEVSLDRLRVSLVSRRDRLALGIALRF